MIESRIFPSASSKVLVVFYILLVIWWVSIFIRGLQETNENYAFSLVYGLIPLGWGLLGFLNVRQWGGFSSFIGKAVLFLSTGIFAWGIGNLIYAYYNLALQVAIPYPSFADAGFILLYPLSAIGVFYLSKATGASFALRKTSGKLALLLIPTFLILLSYYLLFIVARGGEITYDGDFLKLFLDIAFPVGSVIVATFAAIVYGLSFNYLGGFFKKPVLLILIGFFFAYIADFSFSYTTTTGTFFVANWVDLVYPTTFFIISLGISLLNPKSLSNTLSEAKQQ